MVVDSRFCDSNQAPRVILNRVFKLQSNPCIYKRGDSFMFETRKEHIKGKIIKFNNKSFKVISERIEVKKNPITNKLYNIYLLDEV